MHFQSLIVFIGVLFVVIILLKVLVNQAPRIKQFSVRDYAQLGYKSSRISFYR